MDKLDLAKYLAIIFAGISGIIYVIGDPLDKLLSYQGPVFSGALLGWYVINKYTPKDKFVEFEDSLVPVTSILIRSKSWIGFTISAFLIAFWLTPFIFKIAQEFPELYFAAFISDFIGGFIAGYLIPSLKFMEKVIIYSLGFAADIFYVMLLYIYSVIYNISQNSLLDHVLGFVYIVKFSEGILFAVYIIKKVNAI
ncbi:conserved hypothetical protein [Acidianus hospitalis W1]|jgi:hypothetical protein|uniref:DUF1404 domain-containing protein n=1 Tax=Acidianus hospitalis (strain W1) TaxID=933801 RepID=F4B9F3_ACIHW|nr:DUF1404 family protein [Acidianus hospitalis]AEE95099.1 conserved hypothetical protein [Acidianus hospitalis W1]